MFLRRYKNIIEDLKRKNLELRKLRFRVGDQVYVNDGQRDPLKPFFLRESYNGGECYHLSEKLEGYYSTHHHEAAHVNTMSHDRPETCKCCGAQLPTDQTKEQGA